MNEVQKAKADNRWSAAYDSQGKAEPSSDFLAALAANSKAERAFAALDRLGKAYLEFARKEPAYYSAMFEAGIPLDSNPEYRESGDRAFSVLRSATEALIATMPSGRAMTVSAPFW